MSTATEQKTTSPASRDASDEARREAARLMGQVRSPRKAETARANAARRTPDKMGGRPQKALSEIPCTCEAGDALTGHRWDCPRGQAIKRRAKAEKAETL